jgi:hypothetical protein
MSVPLDDVFEVTRWPNLTFYCLFGSATVSSCKRCNAWWRIIIGLLSMIIFFSFLFSLLPDKVHDCSLWFWFFNFSSHFFDFLFHSCSFYSFLFNLVLKLQFLICFFHFGPYSFYFYFFLGTSVKVVFTFNFII